MIAGAGVPEPARCAASWSPSPLVRVRRCRAPARWGGWGSC